MCLNAPKGPQESFFRSIHYLYNSEIIRWVVDVSEFPFKLQIFVCTLSNGSHLNQQYENESRPCTRFRFGRIGIFLLFFEVPYPAIRRFLDDESLLCSSINIESMKRGFVLLLFWFIFLNWNFFLINFLYLTGTAVV